MNSFGNIYTLTSFGESHGPAVGGVIDGVPAGIPVDTAYIQQQLNRRRPGQSNIVTPRNEADSIEILSGVFEGVSTGMPIGFIVRNTSQHSKDYDNLRETYRPSHADFTYHAKYKVRDHRGGGRSSARETISRVVAGAIARRALEMQGITITAYTSAMGAVSTNIDPASVTAEMVEASHVRCPDKTAAGKMTALIEDIKTQGDTVGGVVTCIITGMPAGLGDPVFDKLHARLAFAMMSINAAKGFEYGMGFEGAAHRGSEMADRWIADPHDSRGMHAATNHSGGIQGGISNGEPIVFSVAFKPVATLLKPIDTVDTHHRQVQLQARGRHDPCVVPRAVPIVEAMAAMTIFDALLMNRCARL